MNMKAECINQQLFQLSDKEEFLGKVVYKKLFSYDAEIVLTNAENYHVEPRGFFGTHIVVTKNGTEIADLRMNLKGQIVISMSSGEEFLFKNTTIFSNHFAIENKDGEKIVQYKPALNWSKFNYNYTIANDLKSKNTLLILIGLYAANYYIAVMSGLV